MPNTINANVTSVTASMAQTQPLIKRKRDLLYLTYFTIAIPMAFSNYHRPPLS